VPELDFSNTAQKLARNPLGIIALFLLLVYGIAGLVFGLAAKNLSVLERQPLIWFLVVFPVLVLVLFAWLVARHHTKLYAPSDYRDTEGFFRALSATEQRARVDAEVEVLQAEVVEERERVEGTLSPPPRDDVRREALDTTRDRSNTVVQPNQRQSTSSIVATARRDLRAAVVLAEDLAFRELETEFGAPTVRHVGVSTPSGEYHLDGMIRTVPKIGVEVKYIRSPAHWQQAVDEGIAKAAQLRTISPNPWKLLLAIVLDRISPRQREIIGPQVSARIARSEMSIELRVYDFGELQRKFGVTTA